MRSGAPTTALTRRNLFAAGALLFASATTAKAAPSNPTSWLAYGDRLTARLEDAAGGSFDLDFERTLLNEANQFRSLQGLPALEWDEGLANSARAHAADMIARRYFAHESPEGFTHIDRVSILNRDFCAQTGENLAFRDYPTQPTAPRHFEAMWEGSAGHRRNLLDPAFNQAGYGVVRVGSAIFVAGLYGEVAIRLSHALPMVFNAPAELDNAVASATPNIERLSLTAPFAQPTWMVSGADNLPRLPQGVWQLRPLTPMQGTRYQVLPGPLFHIA